MPTYIQGNTAWHTKKADSKKGGMSFVKTVCGADVIARLPQSDVAPSENQHCPACRGGRQISKR